MNRITIGFAVMAMALVPTSYGQTLPPLSARVLDVSSPVAAAPTLAGPPLGAANTRYLTQQQAMQPIPGVEKDPPVWAIPYLKGQTNIPAFPEPRPKS